VREEAAPPFHSNSEAQAAAVGAGRPLAPGSPPRMAVAECLAMELCCHGRCAPKPANH
jgi:hypothetical protein